MTFDRDEQFLHEKLSADLHPAPVAFREMLDKCFFPKFP